MRDFKICDRNVIFVWLELSKKCRRDCNMSGQGKCVSNLVGETEMKTYLRGPGELC